MSFAVAPEVGFNRALISLTFDDGGASQYTYGNPLMQKYGMLGTYYMISGELNDTAAGYMTTAQMKALDTAGNEIGSHTVPHPDLTTLSITKLVAELTNSQTTLQNAIGKPVPN